MANEYGKAGVDVDIESMGAKILFEASKKTFENRKGNIGEVILPFDDFSGVRAVDVSNLPKGSFMCMGFDTVGTKAEIAQRMNKHDTIAYDLLAMVCDDAILRGGEPVLVGSNLDVNTLGTDETRLPILKELAKGYINAAKDANVAVINGELCQIGHAVGGYGKSLVYNWGAALIWFANKEKMFTSKEIKLNDYIVVFKEKGFRSNGFSLIRKVFQDNFGDNWHDKEFKGDKLGNHVLTPSMIYSKAFVHMHGGFQTKGCIEIHGVSHITGGGLPEKIGRVLRPSSFGAKLDNLFSPCSAMKYCQELGKIEDKEAYKTWNMGQGLAVITPEPEKVIVEAKKFGIDAKIAGKIIQDRKIVIKSKGVFSYDKEIEFFV
jgi:phosphoribosylformylglycinamidine cyclo-ligase